MDAFLPVTVAFVVMGLVGWYMRHCRGGLGTVIPDAPPADVTLKVSVESEAARPQKTGTKSRRGRATQTWNGQLPASQAQLDYLAILRARK